MDRLDLRAPVVGHVHGPHEADVFELLVHVEVQQDGVRYTRQALGHQALVRIDHGPGHRWIGRRPAVDLLLLEGQAIGIRVLEETPRVDDAIDVGLTLAEVLGILREDDVLARGPLLDLEGAGCRLCVRGERVVAPLELLRRLPVGDTGEEGGKARHECAVGLRQGELDGVIVRRLDLHSHPVGLKAEGSGCAIEEETGCLALDVPLDVGGSELATVGDGRVLPLHIFAEGERVGLGIRRFPLLREVGLKVAGVGIGEPHNLVEGVASEPTDLIPLRAVEIHRIELGGSEGPDQDATINGCDGAGARSRCGSGVVPGVVPSGAVVGSTESSSSPQPTRPSPATPTPATAAPPTKRRRVTRPVRVLRSQ
ncbi:MAG: hypothetical protein M5U18_09920 [Dehalococcoidia bacterium]|nr:hypothetical protein [Dehalococcoidia bacterium]